MQLTGKTILVISPQAWGKMLLAKHHYAMELARAGNQVFFLGPPQTQKVPGQVRIVPSGVVPALQLVEHSLNFSYKIKFKWTGLFHFLMKFHIRKIIRAMGGRPDIVWSFDLGNYYPFRYFGNNTYNIFHPVDEPGSQESIRAARGARAIISVTREILEKYHQFNVPKLFVHHGLSHEFTKVQPVMNTPGAAVHAGLSGNWLRPDLDFECLRTIVKQNPGVHFHLWGSFEAGQSNIGGGGNPQAVELINFLKLQPHVTFYGPADTQTLAAAFMKMDVFLICYDIEKDQSKGTNYHKVMEYLSSGKAVVANNITTYATLPGLLEMNDSRTNNNGLPALFSKVTASLAYYNSEEMVHRRRGFALSNLYARKTAEIEKLLP